MKRRSTATPFPATNPTNSNAKQIRTRAEGVQRGTSLLRSEPKSHNHTTHRTVMRWRRNKRRPPLDFRVDRHRRHVQWAGPCFASPLESRFRRRRRALSGWLHRMRQSLRASPRNTCIFNEHRCDEAISLLNSTHALRQQNRHAPPKERNQRC